MNETTTEIASLQQDNARLRQENARLKKSKDKLGLTYKTTAENGEAQKLLQGSIPFLKRIDELSVMKNDNEPNHLLIEGDNISSLTILQQTHREKVDVIYIDPPYNTGHEDFVYNDNFKDKQPKGVHYVKRDDSFRHSKWLSFMAPRLELAKTLLKDTGVIFISIDDNEQAYLKVLMDRIFGEQNFVANLIQDKGNAQNDASQVQKNHEYILVYTKSDNAIIRQKKKISLRVSKDDKGFYTKTGMSMGGGAGGTINGRPKLGYTFYYHPKTGDIIPKQDQDLEKARYSNNESEVYSTDRELISQGFIPVRPPKNKNKLGCWKWSIDKAMNEKERLLVVKTKNGYSLYRKDYKNEENVIEYNGKYFYKEYKDVPSRSILSEFSTSAGTSSLTSILNGDFNNPKNVEMLKYIISLHPSKDAIVLDFFAGSGTTGHAVAELNKEDGGTRQAILCTNNFEQDGAENGIARGITAERMRRVLTGKDWADGKEHDALPGNLTYYQVSFRNNEPYINDYVENFTASQISGIAALETNAHNVLGAEDFDDEPTREFIDSRKIVVLSSSSRIVLVYGDLQTALYFDEKFEEVEQSVKTKSDELGKSFAEYLISYNDDKTSEIDETTTADNFPIPYVNSIGSSVRTLEAKRLLVRPDDCETTPENDNDEGAPMNDN